MRPASLGVRAHLHWYIFTYVHVGARQRTSLLRRALCGHARASCSAIPSSESCTWTFPCLNQTCEGPRYNFFMAVYTVASAKLCHMCVSARPLQQVLNDTKIREARLLIASMSTDGPKMPHTRITSARLHNCVNVCNAIQQLVVFATCHTKVGNAKFHKQTCHSTAMQLPLIFPTDRQRHPETVPETIVKYAETQRPLCWGIT